MKFQMTISDDGGMVRVDCKPPLKKVLEDLGARGSCSPAERAIMVAFDAWTSDAEKTARKNLKTRTGLILPGDSGPLGKF